MKNLGAALAWRSLATFLVITFTAAFVGSFFTVPSMDGWYATLAKSPFTPPDWVFAPVWVVLYAMMAVAAWRVWVRRTGEIPARPRRRARYALGLYGAQLLVNAFWPVAFFGFRDPALALGVIIVLLACVAYIGVSFYRIDRWAGLLFAPYILWVGFATYLNLAIVLMN